MSIDYTVFHKIDKICVSKYGVKKYDTFLSWKFSLISTHITGRYFMTNMIKYTIKIFSCESKPIYTQREKGNELNT